MILGFRTVESPLGPLHLVATDRALVGLEFVGSRREREALDARLAKRLGPHELRERADPAGAASRLVRYFAGECGALDEQAVALHGTDFQVAVWHALRRIPAGDTCTYAQLAARIGRPTARRAVGAANGANPIALFVPCHRVIAADGTLWGYAGGLERKRWLLAHEGAIPNPRPARSRRVRLRAGAEWHVGPGSARRAAR